MPTPFFNYVDFSRPWDDPDGNYDHFLNRGMIHSLLNPSIEESHSPEGLQLAHYAGSDRIFYRNSSVGIPDLKTGAANVLLAGESFGGYPPLGLPVNWRDAGLGLRRHEHGFGYGYLRGRDTFVLRADGACQAFNEDVDGPEFARLIGPDELTPSDEQRAKLTAPFKPPKRYWRRVFVEFEGRAQPWDKPTVWESRNPDGDVVAVEFDYSFKGDKVDPTIAEVKQVLARPTIREVTSHGPLGDEAVPILATLPRLEKLEILGRNLTDRGLAALQSVRSLRELHIGRTAVTADGIEAFRAARPDCRLVVMPEPPSAEP